jgi:hypothetical protein
MTSAKRCCISIVLLLAASVAWAGYTADLGELVKKAEPWTPQTITSSEPVTKAAYQKTLVDFFTPKLAQSAYYLAQPKPYPNMSFNIQYALWLARGYKADGQQEMANKAVGYVEHAYRLIAEPQTDTRNTVPGWLEAVDLYYVDKWLAGNPAYTPQAAKHLRAIALKGVPNCPEATLEYGAFNRSFHAALAGEALLKLVPNAPDADKWRKYCDTIWNYWWQFRDQDESTDHYTALWFRYLLMWVEMRGVEKEFWADPGIKQLMERYLAQVFPLGAFPNYSDSTGWNVTWGHWIHIFEACATHYRDGRYKWAAHRLYNYGSNRIEKLNSWSYTGDEAVWSIWNALDVADDAIAEKPRDGQVILTMRHKATMRPWPEIQKTHQFLELSNDMVPDKMLFYSGSDPDALSLMVDVVGDAGHSHARRPALLALTDHQSALLISLGYMERRAEDHNMAQVSDYDGYPYDSTEYHMKNANNLVQAVSAKDLGPIGYGRVQVGNYMGYPATCARDIVFIKNVGVVVKDTLDVTVDLTLRWGQLYRVRNLGPDFAPNWANTYLGPWVPLRGLGPNAGVYTRWKNSPRDLLVYYLPDAKGALEVVDDGKVDKTIAEPLRLQYTLRQPAGPNAPVCGATLLLPHAPGPGKPLADKVRTLRHDPQCTVLEFTGEDGDTHLIALNRTGAPIKIANVLATDAQVAYARKRGQTITAAALQGGKQLIAYGKDVTAMTGK